MPKGKILAFFKKGRRSWLPLLCSAVILVLLILLPTGFESAVDYTDADRCEALVTAVDNDRILDTGLVRSGEQRCTLTFLGGRFKGQSAEGINTLNGSLEKDKVFAPGDHAYVLINYADDDILSVSVIDHYRLNLEVVLAVAFALALILVAGKTGARALLSFAITVLTLWKVVVPLYLQGYNPVLIGLAVTLFLVSVTVVMVYGFDKLSLSAILGSALGVLTTLATGILFTDLFRIHGAIMPSSESLLYSGFQSLNLTKIFMASIFIGSSGAMMDLAVDITAAVNEVVGQNPRIGPRAAMKSGMNVGRAAIGTMTTTLLLAYSGGYLALLMVFMAQGTPIDSLLNYKYVAAELIDTVVGSFGLVTVVPFTALTSGLLLTRHSRRGPLPLPHVETEGRTAESEESAS